MRYLQQFAIILKAGPCSTTRILNPCRRAPPKTKLPEDQNGLPRSSPGCPENPIIDLFRRRLLDFLGRASWSEEHLILGLSADKGQRIFSLFAAVSPDLDHVLKHQQILHSFCMKHAAVAVVGTSLTDLHRTPDPSTRISDRPGPPG